MVSSVICPKEQLCKAELVCFISDSLENGVFINLPRGGTIQSRDYVLFQTLWKMVSLVNRPKEQLCKAELVCFISDSLEIGVFSNSAKGATM